MPHTVRRSRFTLAALALGAVFAVLAACTDVEAPNDDPATVVFGSTLGVNLSQMTRTSSGLYVQDIVTGQGAVADSGKAVRVYYTGWLSSGQQFETNRNSTPFGPFTLGTGAVIKGWDEGVKGMRVGGRRRLVIPPALGYGGTTNGLIPAGSVLVFDVELVSVA